MSGLDDRQRRALAQLVLSARSTLLADAERTLRGSYGILPDGTIQPEASLASDAGLRAQRRVLEDVIAHLRIDGASAEAAVKRLARDVAFTHLNRLLAIRVADALGVLAPSLRDGPDSTGFRQWVTDLAPLLANADDTGGYWNYLGQCAAELAVDAPALFDPRNPLLALQPSKAALEDVVAGLCDPNTTDLWDADDTFGWAYQFFNTKDERQEMRSESAAPRDSWELAVRNQFFTPDYVVRFLVHNTLGRRLVDADPSTPLLEQLSLLVDPPTARGNPVDLAEVKVLDPACGSGHFLLGCYDILEAAWAIRGVPAADAAARIVPCLWGIDIDPRAVQVAQAAVIFRARRACGRALLPPPNIICARALPEDSTAWAHAEAGLSDDLRRLINALRAALRDAPILGPLLKAEQRLASEIRSRIVGTDDTGDDLFATAGIAHDNFGNAERAVIAALQRAADATTASPAERLLAADAADAVRFVEAVRNRYDAVLMNPPFGEPVAATKDYLRAAYPWIPTRDYNLLAAFVGRGLELCKPEGYVGAITSRAGMFLKTFEAWRVQVLLANRLMALADLGHGVMEEAMVEAAAYVLSPSRPTPEHEGIYIRLLKEVDRPRALAETIATARRGDDDQRVFHVASDAFAAIPGSPMAYWMPDSIRRLFTEVPRLEGNGGEARQGLASGDDFRFVRLVWEVHPRDIARSREETEHGKRWVLFAKGGEYSPYWSDLHLVLDWQRDGQRIRNYPGARPQNIQYFFRPGVTWPLRTQGGFNPSVLPAGCAFGHKGPAIFASSTDASTAVLAGLMVRPSLLVVGALATFGAYEVGAIQRTPMVASVLDNGERATVLDSTRRVITRLAARNAIDETARKFETFSTNHGDHIAGIVEAERRHRVEQSLESLSDLAKIDVAYSQALRLDDAAIASLEQQLGPPIWANAPGIADEADHAASPLGPYLVDAELEGYARTNNVPLPAAAQALLSNPVSRDEIAVRAADLVSWLVGVAFGRWDIRGSRASQEFDPFAPLSICPPAMLVGDDGFPTLTPPADYPIAIPSDGVLVDQPGHPLDIVLALEAAAQIAPPNGEELLGDAVSVLGRRTLRDYLAKAFFKSHLVRYSKSRRQAPVYWQLTIPTGTWSAWLYAPSFSREMLYAIVSLADHRLATAADKIRALQEDEGGSARLRQKAIDEERTLATELQRMRDDVSRLASLGWRPDSNDGYVLCAAPLAQWFPRSTWRQLTEQLAEIRKGAYPWASVHQFRERL